MQRFVAVIDGKPRLLVEAKLSDEAFAPSLAHFLKFMPGAAAVQVVKHATRAKSDARRSMRLEPAASFLAELTFLEVAAPQ